MQIVHKVTSYSQMDCSSIDLKPSESFLYGSSVSLLPFLFDGCSGLGWWKYGKENPWSWFTCCLCVNIDIALRREHCCTAEDEDVTRRFLYFTLM